MSVGAAALAGDAAGDVTLAGDAAGEAVLAGVTAPIERVAAAGGGAVVACGKPEIVVV